MLDDNAPDNPQAPVNTQPAQPQDPIAALQEQLALAHGKIEQVNGRATQLGKDLGRLRSKLRDDDPVEGEQPVQPAATSDNSAAEATAAYKLGLLTSQLGDTGAQAVQDLLASGKSCREALQIVELASRLAPAQQPAAIKQAPAPGIPATSAVRGSLSHPTTVAEYVNIVKNDPERAKALRADLTFDPTNLKR